MSIMCKVVSDDEITSAIESIIILRRKNAKKNERLYQTSIIIVDEKGFK